MNTFQMLDVTERTSSVVWDSSKPHSLCLRVTGYPRIWMLKRAQTHMAVFRANKLYHIEHEMEPESVMWLRNTCVKFEVDVPPKSPGVDLVFCLTIKVWLSESWINNHIPAKPVDRASTHPYWLSPGTENCDLHTLTGVQVCFHFSRLNP